MTSLSLTLRPTLLALLLGAAAAHADTALGEQETRTAKQVADHLKSLGLEVRTHIARTGVVGILKGAKPGRTVALRADMDALPVKEPAGLPFASQAKGDYHGTEVDVMHACGHDAHTAMLMATASVLAGHKDQLPGTVMFIFQPAEEGSSLVLPGPDASWGAKKMLEEGLFEEFKPDAIFALHVMPGPSGQLSWRTGATTAASDMLNIRITGSQGHGGKVATAELPGAAEDFSFFAQEVPGLYLFLGITPDGQDPATAAPNHNPQFFVDESALVVGTRAMATMVADYLSGDD